MTDTTSPSNRDRPLAGLARRLRDNPAYMAHILAIYQRHERLDEKALADHLGTTPEMLTRLALCKRPEANSPQFAQQVRQLAAYTQSEAGQLANLIRQVDSLERLADRPAVPGKESAETSPRQLRPGLLAAARDRSDTDEADQAPPPRAKPDEEA